MGIAQTAVLPDLDSHFHLDHEQCPVCEQPISREKFSQIKGRIAAQERDLTDRLKEQFANEKVEASAKAKAELDRVRSDAASALEKQRGEAAVKEAAALAEGRKAAEAAMQPQLVAAEQQMRALKESQENAMIARLQEQREALEKQAQSDANARESKFFEEKQKLEATLQDAQRQLQNKTAQELGEGAEIDLFEELRREFPDDRIVRVGKGAPGADVLHTVCNNGKECGLIVYDSKNHKAWRNEFVNKLRDDQISAKADHAILSSHVFPSGVRQLHVQVGVIVTNPARVVALVQVLRRHIVQIYGLRISNEARSQKTQALYEFITSERYQTLLDQIETDTVNLLDLEVKEEKAHRATWMRRGQLICDIQKVGGNLSFEIGRIIGTAETRD
jgi:hypothetical protein